MVDLGVVGTAVHAAGDGCSSGTWYEAFALDDGRVAISVGRVADGVSGAQDIAGEARRSIREAALSDGLTPSEVLHSAGNELHANGAIGVATGIFATYDAADSRLAYACAGHPAPSLSLAGGLTRELPAGGKPFGYLGDSAAPTWTFTIPAGARSAFYCTTDREEGAVLTVERTARVSKFVFSAQPVVSPLARAIVEQTMQALPMSDDKRFGVLVAVGEAIANAVEHAYHGRPPGLVRLDVDVQPRNLSVTIEDFGRWRPRVEREGRGRGLELMEAFTDGLKVESTPASTSIFLTAQFDALVG